MNAAHINRVLVSEEVRENLSFSALIMRFSSGFALALVWHCTHVHAQTPDNATTASWSPLHPLRGIDSLQYFSVPYTSQELVIIQPQTISARENSSLYFTSPFGTAVQPPASTIYRETGEVVWVADEWGLSIALTPQWYDGNLVASFWIGNFSNSGTGSGTVRCILLIKKKLTGRVVYLARFIIPKCEECDHCLSERSGYS